MKKIIIPMLALVAGVSFTACEDQLDIEQKGVMAVENFYKSDADCSNALAHAYENFQINTLGRTTLGPGIYTPARVLANHPGDDICYGGEYYGDHEFGGSVNEFRFLHTPEAIICHYKGLYLSIYCDNLVIDNFKEGTTQVQKQSVAEARVLRAYNYFLLACYWGTPPFVDHTLNAGENPTNSHLDARPEAPKTQQDYFKWVASECLAAVGDLIERKSPEDKDGAYRVTKGFAYALAGKALMFAEDFAGAKDALKKVIDSGKYALVPGEEYMDQFHIQGDGSPEKVFEMNFRYNPSAGEWSSGSGMGYKNHSTWMECNTFQIRSDKFKKPPLQTYTGSVTGWGSIGVPEWYGEAFALNDNGHAGATYDQNGKETYVSYRFRATLAHIDDLIYGETGIETIDNYYSKLSSMKHADKVKNDKIGIKAGRRGHYGQSFFVPIKHVIRAGDAEEAGGTYGTGDRLNNVIVMRYAEVLLNYAECCLRTGDAGSAKTYINMIQERAGSKTISDNVDLVTLKKEKSFELWFESCRYQDLLRWSKLDNDSYTSECMDHLKKQGTYVPNLCDKLSEKPDQIVANWEGLVWENGDEKSSRFFIIHTHDAMDAQYEVGWQEKHRLFPYPQTLLDNNPALEQNDGWK